ncbi:MAG: gamma carbonic anhydrase family protein [Pseudomonadota bacterium]
MAGYGPEQIFALDGVAPEIDPTAWVAPGARLMGKVRLLPGASVWFNAVLRGDNEWIEIGENSNVQDGAVLHTDPGCPLTVGANCTVGHNAILHGCTLEPGCLVGMGATVLNRAVIPSGALVGANALVSEGKTFAPNSLLLGAPAKAVKDLGEGSAQGILMSAQHYAANAKRYREGLKAV